MTEVMIWDPAERFLWGVAFTLIFIVRLLYFKNAHLNRRYNISKEIYGRISINYLNMTHKLIDIPEETYNRLTELRQSNETIPDLLTRLIDSSNELKEGLSTSVKKKIIDKLNLALKKFKEDTINLPDDWDGQGSKGFSEQLWQNVTNFLLLIYIELHAEELEAPFPLVLPNVDGSLDIDWETESFELLINFPPDPEALIHMFGEKMGSPKNELDVRINRELAGLVVSEWLKKIL